MPAKTSSVNMLNEVYALQSLHKQIPGVTVSDDFPRGNLEGIDLPRIVTLPGPGTWNRQTFGRLGAMVGAKTGVVYKTDRVYIVKGYVRAVAETLNPDEGIVAAATLLEQVGRLYMATTKITTETGVYEILAENITDGGPRGDLKWNPASKDTYYGFEFQVGVTDVNG